jgi:SAM-dependent methyltransferase
MDRRTIEQMDLAHGAEREAIALGRATMSDATDLIDRGVKLLGELDIPNQVGLEFGALNRPLVRREQGDIRYVDVLPTEELRRNTSEFGDYKRAEFVDVDYVWSRGNFREAIGSDTEFDYALASHVIEHTPNMIGWLDDVLSVLKPGGLMCLAVPDKRYTFDILRAPTPPSIVIDNYLRQEAMPRAQHIFDHYSQVVEISADQVRAAWHGLLDHKTLRRYHSDEDALRLARHAETTGQYVEGHMYVFTPRSMLKLLEMAIGLGLLRAQLYKFWDTAHGSFEFIFILRKPDSAVTDDRLRSDVVKTSAAIYPVLRD